MRIALAQINPTVGDIAGNADLIRRDLDRAIDLGVSLVVYPELAIIGYPPKDLMFKPEVISACGKAIEDLASCCTEVAALIGYPCPSDRSDGQLLYNAVAVCVDGRVVGRCVKSLLPTYDVFDELRYFEPGPPDQIAPVSIGPEKVQLGVSICEDLWSDQQLCGRRLYHNDPIADLACQGAQIFINCAASPFVVGKQAFRLKLMAKAARLHGLPLLYCNQVGANDDLVFDGSSCAFDCDGNLIAHAKDFEADLLMVDVETDTHTPRTAVVGHRLELHKVGIESAYHALVMGLRDYCAKCRFGAIVLGLSGGIDSAVTCAVSVAALGSDKVQGISMPGRFSSNASRTDAEDLAGRLGIQLQTIPIDNAHQAVEQMLGHQFEGLGVDQTEENIQARVRGVILMAMSNKLGSLLVTTGNKSELAVGYCTLYGDMAGGMAVLSDVPKTMVYEMACWINEDPASPLRQQYGGPVIPQSSITKPPSAELREDQADQDSLPPYEILDEIIERYIEHNESADRIVDQTKFDPQVVWDMVQLIDRNEYKRKQAAPGLKITGRAFGFGRRMPIAQRWNEKAD